MAALIGSKVGRNLCSRGQTNALPQLALICPKISRKSRKYPLYGAATPPILLGNRASAGRGRARPLRIGRGHTEKVRGGAPCTAFALFERPPVHDPSLLTSRKIEIFCSALASGCPAGLPRRGVRVGAVPSLGGAAPI